MLYTISENESPGKDRRKGTQGYYQLCMETFYEGKVGTKVFDECIVEENENKTRC